jgi:CHAT domain-containing protein
VSLSEILTQLLSAPPEQQLPKIQAKLSADIAQLKADREKLKREIEQAFPEYAELVDPKPVAHGQVQKALKPDETLLSYYFGEDRGYVWALRGSGEIRFAQVPLARKEIATRVARLRAALDPQVASINELPAFDLAAAHELYNALVKPIAGALEGSRLLLVVPHGELGQLPLALLPTAPASADAKGTVPFEGYRKVPWLMRQLAIEQLPSVTALASLRRLPPGNASRRSFVGFGDPLFSKEQAKEPSLQLAAADATVKTRGVPLRLRNAPKTSGVSSAELALLPRLPDTGQEITEIAKVLKADAADIFLQTKANEKAVLGGDLSNRRVVMFATHGLVPGELDGLTQPALALTTPDLADGNGDGLLAMDEILSLKLDADWVVLSACNTAAGEGAGSEAVSGLGRAFFYAGARALLVSNWPVETVSARMLMTDLFRRQVADPKLGKAEALRQAMLALADGPGGLDAAGKPLYAHAHPLFWAPFVIVGD